MFNGIKDRGRRRWERMPLRVRLTGAVLVLVAGALVLTSVANVTSLHGYMLGQVNSDLKKQFESGDLLSQESNRHVSMDYLLYAGDDKAMNPINGTRPARRAPDLHLDKMLSDIGTPFTVDSKDGELRWQVKTMRYKDLPISDEFVLKNKTQNVVYITLATPLSTMDNAVSRLVWIDLLVGAGVLAGLAAIGAALVRASLYPLKEMEQTTGSIAAGDLSQRVLERDPRTEVGRLGRSFNKMLGHIESALAAREESEARARASEERMRRFVADASHELRTPLTTVRGFAELYRQRGDVGPEEEADLMRRIEDEATRMGMLVEDLLLLARLDQERPLQMHQVDLLSVAVDTISAIRLSAGDRTIDLDTEGGPFLVQGDDMRLRQVLSNLVTNAVRHTPGDAHVWVSLYSDDNNVVLTVADDGPGMEQEQVERVFERFYRADKARSRSAGGTGLGLAIVAALVAAHRGDVAVDSAPGEGAKFTVRLGLDPEVRAVAREEDASQRIDSLGQGSS